MSLPRVDSFRGEVPRVAKRKLPVEYATQALNCRLLSGDLECFKNFELIQQLAKAGEIRTIYPLEDTLGNAVWLSWTQGELGTDAVEVDVAKSISSTDGRVFLTGLDLPRWTNLSLATQSGSDQYPVVTRPLGVPNPDGAPTATAAIASDVPINVTDAGDQLTSWNVVGFVLTPSSVRYVIPDATVGNPLPSYRLVQQATPTMSYAIRDFGVIDSNYASIQSDFYVALATTVGHWSYGLGLQSGSGGAGPRVGVGVTAGGTILSIGNGVGFDDGVGSIVASSIIGALPVATWYKLKQENRRQANGTISVTATVMNNSGTVLATLTADGLAHQGGYGMFLAANSSDYSAGSTQILADNFIVQGTGNFNDASDDVATSYVYTFVNDIGEESGPSEASATVFRDTGTTITVTTPTSPPTGYGSEWYIETKRIYRALTVGGVTTFFFVVEIPLAQANYTDTLADAQLGEELESTLYALPPQDLRGILALPNEIYAGFTGTELCLSAQGRPHAWPIQYRLRTDEPIVAIGNIDTVIAIATREFPYTAAGTEPANYGMTKSEVKQGCVAKRGSTYLKAYGWVYPSPDGLVAIAGVGQVKLLTAPLFTRREWQALVPETLIAEVHDDRYVACYIDCDENKRGILLEMAEGGFGKVTFGFHATALYSWAKTDTLYMVLDENEPPAVGSPQSDYQVTPNGTTIYAFDSYCNEDGTLTKYLPQQWTSKKFPMGGVVPLMCRIRATDFVSVRLILYNQGWPYFVFDVPSNKPFRLPKPYTIEDYFQFAIQGTSFVQDIAFGYNAEDFEE